MSEIMPCISPLGAEERPLMCMDAELLLGFSSRFFPWG